MEKLLELKENLLRGGDIAGALIILEELESALNSASLEVCEGIYTPDSLAQKIDRPHLIDQALAAILAS